MTDIIDRRILMVAQQIAARGIHDSRLLAAMREVPRERFVPPRLAEFAFEDSPLPIEEEQTISQPYIVALMIEALDVAPDDRVLEVGTGSGYAAAVLSRLCAKVYTIERHGSLADSAAQRLAALGYDNVEVRTGDGSVGWPGQAPFDAIVVAAGGPRVPKALLAQLAIGGRLVIPVGPPGGQSLTRIERVGESDYHTTDLGAVQFVPLLGDQGWGAAKGPSTAVSRLIAEVAERMTSIEDAPLDGLLDRIGSARIVLLGEASHGTAEFYRLRASITRELVLRRGFRAIAVEADWPDAAAIDRAVRQLGPSHNPDLPFTRFPTWMWRNREVAALVGWLSEHNRGQAAERQVHFHGLDLYSLATSVNAVLRYLDTVDPTTARVARERYACLTPWQKDPEVYGHAAVTGQWRSCERDVVGMLQMLLEKRIDYSVADGDRFFDAEQNARLVTAAERYYRAMYDGRVESWNLRDQHMFDTLERLRRFHGRDAGIVVWEHNSHVGNALATEMAARGEYNVGQLAREAYGQDCYVVGFGTDHGTVAAASTWGAPMQVMRVRPALARSYERLSHDSGVPAFLLPLTRPRREEVRDELSAPRLERAIGVIYRPDSERLSHYFDAVLPMQFDEYVWFDETTAVTPLPARQAEGIAETYPFGL